MSFFKQNWLKQFAALEYESKSHSLNKAVIAAYYNVAKYGFERYQWGLRIKQARRVVNFHTNHDILFDDADSKSINLSEKAVYPKKNKEVCYDLHYLFLNRETQTSELKRGLNFSKRPDVEIVDYKKDDRLDHIYEGWKKTKEEDPKTFLMTFNPARYYRSYDLLDNDFLISQKLILIKKKPYAVINFALQNAYAYELSFLSLFKDPELKLINDQNDCIITHCLYELFTRHGVGMVNLGTSAGIKGLGIFKRKHPNFEQIVYST